MMETKETPTGARQNSSPRSADFCLPYRRFVIGRAPQFESLDHAGARRIQSCDTASENLRYERICHAPTPHSIDSTDLNLRLAKR